MGRREEWWGGILRPNYYVRMLNGISDAPFNSTITRGHLEKAKAVLSTFDTVLILEDGNDSNLEKLHALFGADEDGKNEVRLQKLSNNGLRNVPTYEQLRKQMDKMETLFQEQNQLDLELYDYARATFSSKRAGAVESPSKSTR